MKKFLFALLLLFSAYSYSQNNIRFAGILRDSIGPLEMGNVMAVNKATNAMDSYAITDDKGRFQLILKPNTPYIIKASYIGYMPFQEEISATTLKI